MKLFDNFLFFLLYAHSSSSSITENAAGPFFRLKCQHKWNAWLLVFCFTGYFSAFQSFLSALLILIWHLKPAGFWKLADSDWVCLMGVKAQIKKAECGFTDMNYEIRPLQSSRTVSTWLNPVLYLSHYILCVCQ